MPRKKLPPPRSLAAGLAGLDMEDRLRWVELDAQLGRAGMDDVLFLAREAVRAAAGAERLMLRDRKINEDAYEEIEAERDTYRDALALLVDRLGSLFDRLMGDGVDAASCGYDLGELAGKFDAPIGRKTHLEHLRETLAADKAVTNQ